MITFRIMNVDDHLVIVLNDDALDHLGVKDGDGVCFSKLPDGFHVTKADQEFVRQMKAADEMSMLHHDTLRKLGQE